MNYWVNIPDIRNEYENRKKNNNDVTEYEYEHLYKHFMESTLKNFR